VDCLITIVVNHSRVAGRFYILHKNKRNDQDTGFLSVNPGDCETTIKRASIDAQ